MSARPAETTKHQVQNASVPAPESQDLPSLGAPSSLNTPLSERPLSQRVFALQQIIPLLILGTVMFYEVAIRLIFENTINPAIFAIETIIFGIFGSGFTLAVLNWVGREIAKRERAEVKADTLRAMMQEMHHRIKNNLQTVADLLSLEMSRNPQPEVQASLRDSITRIKSIAASHEMLSHEQVGTTNITELARLVSNTARRAMVHPDQKIEITVEGPGIYLTSKQATAFALVLNELVSNAIEHGFRMRQHGNIEIVLDGDAEDVWMRVRDDGEGLPPGFDIKTARGLGLQIARTLVEKDLRGKMGMTNCSDLKNLEPDQEPNLYDGRGAMAWVHFGRGATG
jgi:two-component sensor histidine kinase